MERDANSAPSSPADAVPLANPDCVRTIALVGVGLTAAAATIGLVALGMGDSAAGAIKFSRLLLVLVGAVTAGSALSQRYDLWWVWGLAAIAFGLAVLGTPASWDSFRLLFGILAGVAAAGLGFCLVAPAWRYGVGSAMLLFHFVGIFMATTMPPATPWLSEQLYYRVYTPYLQFLYLRNAYHFYSPEPGPASLLVFFLKTDTGETETVIDPQTQLPKQVPKYETKWVVFPLRPGDIRDPLGLTYFRRLSLTEQLARGTPGLQVPSDTFEKLEMYERRMQPYVIQAIPLHPAEPTILQYRLPNPDVARFLLPSYASHVILDHTPDAETAGRTTVKVYRLEHRTLEAQEFRRRMPDGHFPSPYSPGTYRPYFIGEFNAKGDLLNPQEELLYWMIPVVPREPAPNDTNKKRYDDYLSVHALETSIDEVRRADPKAGKVFNWDQMRWSLNR